jgi:OmpA-OmpF porin, OOP family
MKKLVICFFISSFIFKMNAQVNLVPNPSFETYTSCPMASGQISFASPWNGITTNSTDYYNACSTGTAGVPTFAVGDWQYAKTGAAYAGLWVINGYGSNYREYLQVKLNSILQQDSCYLVEFYCNPINAARYGVNKMGAYLSSTAVNAVGPGLVMTYTPQIILNQFLTDTLNWFGVGGYYKANGGEQYITIGNFSTDTDTDTLHIGGSNYDGAYYFIDDVTVKKIAGCDTTAGIQELGIKNEKFKVYPNPAEKEFTIESKELKIESIKIYNVLGELVKIQEQIDNTKTTIDISHLQKGIYFYQVTVNDKIVKSGKLIIIK